MFTGSIYQTNALGSLATAERSRSITEVVREMLPDHDVHNEVAVETPTAPRGSEQMR